MGLTGCRRCRAVAVDQREHQRGGATTLRHHADRVPRANRRAAQDRPGVGGCASLLAEETQ
jgi:hypothetical protein